MQFAPPILQFVATLGSGAGLCLKLGAVQFIGDSIVKKLLSALLAASLLFCTSAFADNVADARAAAEKWMKLMDTEEYSAAWNTGAENLRKGMPKMGWNLLSSTIHMPLGALKSRSFKSVETSTPTSVTLEYLADYENSHKVQEKYTATLESDGVWRISGYTINSDAPKPAK
jgi:hypothetical protein